MSQTKPQSLAGPHCPGGFARESGATAGGVCSWCPLLMVLAVAPFARGLDGLSVYPFDHRRRLRRRRISSTSPRRKCRATSRRLPGQEQDVVAAGQLLVEVDPVPYREQVDLLEAKLGVAQAQLDVAQASLEVLQAQVPREIEIAQKARPLPGPSRRGTRKHCNSPWRMWKRRFTRRSPNWQPPRPG